MYGPFEYNSVFWFWSIIKYIDNCETSQVVSRKAYGYVEYTL